MLDWLGYQLLMLGPWRVVCNPNTRFGTWCLQRAGAWAYRDKPVSQTTINGEHRG